MAEATVVSATNRKILVAVTRGNSGNTCDYLESGGF
jgi:hypothetical protein